MFVPWKEKKVLATLTQWVLKTKLAHFILFLFVQFSLVAWRFIYRVFIFFCLLPLSLSLRLFFDRISINAIPWARNFFSYHFFLMLLFGVIVRNIDQSTKDEKPSTTIAATMLNVVFDTNLSHIRFFLSPFLFGAPSAQATDFFLSFFLSLPSPRLSLSHVQF